MSSATPNSSLYVIDDSPGWESLREQLDPRQLRLVESALSFHSLVSPGRRLAYHVHLGGTHQYPRLTDEGSCHDGCTKGTRRLGSFTAQSLVKPTSDFQPQVLASYGQVVRDTNERFLLVTPPEATDETVQAAWHRDWKPRLYSFLEERGPAVLDIIRNFFWRRWEKERDRRHPRRDYTEELRRLRESTPWPLPIPRLAGPMRPEAPKAVIIGMHWLQAGGAERWAVETIRLVQEAGLVPIVITDHDSHQPWITRPELDGALVLCLTHPIAGFPADDLVLRALLEQYDVRGVLVHHCQWLYDRLPWMRLSRPDLQVADSLHVLEFTGGYPRAAAVVSEEISHHHVISGQLRDWLINSQGIAEGKIVLAPLSNLTLAESRPAGRLHSPNATLTLAFVGRSSRQKRPETFLLLIRAARRAGLNIRAIMHGDGELDGLVARTISRHQLSEIVEVRTSARPVADTFAEADVLVITSSNEGITLTTFEALAARVPVISADVGAQREVIPPEALLPRQASGLIPRALGLIRALEVPATRERILDQEREAIDRLAQNQQADAWLKGVLSEWAR